MDITSSKRRAFTGAALLCIAALMLGCQGTARKAAPEDSHFTSNPLQPAQPEMETSSGLGGPEAATGTGGATPDNSNIANLRIGDALVVTFNDLPTAMAVLPVQDTIKEDGSITLKFNERFEAAGKSTRQLQAEIRERYVPKYYRYMTPSVTTSERYFSVGGEVKSPNRYVWTSGMTVLRAVTASGGFTDFSRKGKVEIIRADSGKVEYQDCLDALKHPELDKPIYPNDQVHVRKRPI